MKLIHTADWHLGKLVHGLHMTEDQEHLLKQFIDLVREEQPDAIIVAGDLYDRSVPPKEAVELLNQVFTEIIFDLQIPILAITGNHDSPDRLNFGSKMFRRQGLYLQTHLHRAFHPVQLTDEHGPVNFYLIPYVEPGDVRAYFERDDLTTHQQSMEAIIDEIKKNMNDEERHVFIGHAFLAGGMESESEERLTMLGGTPYIDASLFEPFDYVAFGHLHQPQKVWHENIRYSGSLMKYSFSEARQKKSITILELQSNGEVEYRLHPLQPLRDMRIVEGYLQDLLQIEEESTDRNDYIHVQLLDEGQLVDPMGKLRKVYPNVLSLERVGLLGRQTAQQWSKVEERKKMTPIDLFQSFYKEVKGKDLDDHRKVHVSHIIQRLTESEREK
ncbi:exonuclease SbcD [Pontibacillus halophilus JSM 076056 = DSM 19796]|uniref:Nuclease SbcCD subunit D n=1 Tax=Pontibacillus halophilus JSM 076056 = DSM 19796 TaxID=1385510 RepID=A0A0A5I7Z2_9BACI|nr:exonuclease SbcCD subunit D [Pontibacillus halophilus]KGX91952.1 exonuclease SbcD [Pontibacillus halophilus JSM 076056 = DSM 19796]